MGPGACAAGMPGEDMLFSYSRHLVIATDKLLSSFQVLKGPGALQRHLVTAADRLHVCVAI